MTVFHNMILLISVLNCYTIKIIRSWISRRSLRHLMTASFPGCGSVWLSIPVSLGTGLTRIRTRLVRGRLWAAPAWTVLVYLNVPIGTGWTTWARLFTTTALAPTAFWAFIFAPTDLEFVNQIPTLRKNLTFSVFSVSLLFCVGFSWLGWVSLLRGVSDLLSPRPDISHITKFTVSLKIFFSFIFLT